MSHAAFLLAINHLIQLATTYPQMLNTVLLRMGGLNASNHNGKKSACKYLMMNHQLVHGHFHSRGTLHGARMSMT